MDTFDRNELLKGDEEFFLRFCKVEHYKDTGPGGQKRNKTASAVRVTHKDSGVFATAADDRQQSINKIRAIRNLRFNIACEIRREASVWDGAWGMSTKNHDYAGFVAVLLDAMEKFDYQVSSVGEFFTKSTGQIIKTLAKDDHLWQFVNQQRQKRQLKPLKKK